MTVGELEKEVKDLRRFIEAINDDLVKTDIKVIKLQTAVKIIQIKNGDFSYLKDEE